ncbi:hypothetical protein LINGRAHAP2_LOCUS25541 [Linum grandiflorum]
MAAKQAVQSYSPLKPIASSTDTTRRSSRPTSLSTLSCSKSQPLLLFSGPAPARSTAAVVKCSGETPKDVGSGSNLKDALTGLVGKEVAELLAKEENKALLDELDKASQRVEIARKELAEIERQEAEAKQLQAYVNQLETRASEVSIPTLRLSFSVFKIEECQQEILAARAMVEEAEKSLSAGNGATEKDLERVESIKAAGVSAIIGSLAVIPVSLNGITSYDQLLLPITATFISCALFGVTFRYAVRRDLDNFQLKTGTYAAFGFVKGLGMLAGGAPLQLNSESILSHAVDAALCVSQSLLVFAFSAVSLDYCFKVGLISPFPLKESDSSQTNAD